MDDYLATIKHELLCGISAEHWLNFFSIFTEQKETKEVTRQIEELSKKASEFERGDNTTKAEALQSIIQGIQALI